jgi:hypothetical protein
VPRAAFASVERWMRRPSRISPNRQVVMAGMSGPTCAVSAREYSTDATLTMSVNPYSASERRSASPQKS